MISSVVIGFVKGLGGPDLEKWRKDLPKALAEKVGAIIRENFDSVQGLNETGQELLKEILDEDEELATEAMSIIIGQEAESKSDDSLLPDYLEVLNTIVKILRESKRSIVLKGFLHSDNCLTYWEYKDDISEFEKHPTLEIIMSYRTNPEIYIIESNDLDSDLDKMNLHIRKTGALESKADIKVDGIREFEFDTKFSMIKNNTIEIPLGAPGMIALITSAPHALKSQGVPKKLLLSTMQIIKDEIKET